jgi:hypothetical protein
MILEVDYENARISCRGCDHVNIFNRATDLPGRNFISGAELPCRECGQAVRIPVDNANPAYELFIFAAYRLESERRYMQAVAAVAQAYEMFFGLAADAILLWHPYHNTALASVPELNETGELLFETTKTWNYRKMRNFFIRLALAARPSSFAESRVIIGQALALSSDPDDAALDQAPINIATLLHQLKDYPVDTLRNRVLHKRAYRPTEQEATAVIAPANKLLGELWVALDLSSAMRGV